jgi:hypothetical protein
LQCIFLAKKTWQNWVWTSVMGLCQQAPFYRNKDSNLLIRNWVETRRNGIYKSSEISTRSSDMERNLKWTSSTCQQPK